MQGRSTPTAKSTKPKKSGTPASRKKERRSLNEREGNNRRYHALSPAEKLERSWRRMVRPYGLMRAKGAALSKHSQRSRALVDAYCDWSDGEEVYRLYLAAHVMTAYFGQKYVVDHIVPLQSLLVCGLHTHTNLRVDLADDNRLKGNVFWPDMWDANWETLVFVLESR